jgi:hypothetical protein
MVPLKSTIVCTESNNKTRGETASERSLTESRFKTFLYFLRLVGIPLNIKRVSAVHAAYNGIIIVCFYITTISIYTDTYAHREDLAYVMRKIRVLLGMNLVTWLHISFRYDAFLCFVIKLIGFMILAGGSRVRFPVMTLHFCQFI